MAEDLSPADRSSLAAEQGPVSMAVGGVLVFESEIGHERLIERIGSRLHLVPRYRQRLQHAASGITNPVWVDDDHFDIRWHVRVTRLSAPGSDAQLAELVGTEMSRRLDRARPLWEVTLVEGLEGGRNAVLAKMHHALVDGIAAIDIGTVILDPTPEPLDLRPGRRVGAAALRPPPAPGEDDGDAGVARAAGAARRRAARDDHRPAPRRRGPAARNRADDPARQHAAGGADDVAEPRDRAEPQLRDADGLAAGAQGRRQAARRDGQRRDPRGRRGDAPRRRAGRRPGRARAGVGTPRAARRAATASRRCSSTCRRTSPIRSRGCSPIHEQMAKLKDSAAVRAGALLVGASGWAPPLVSSALARAMSGVRAFNLVVSNLPGPQQPFYLSGVRLERVHPIVPLNPSSQGLTVGVLSYDGTVLLRPARRSRARATAGPGLGGARRRAGRAHVWIAALPHARVDAMSARSAARLPEQTMTAPTIVSPNSIGKSPVSIAAVEVLKDPGDAERVLDEHHVEQRHVGRRPGHRQHRRDRRPDRVVAKDVALAQPLGARRSQVVLSEDLDRLRAHDAQRRARERESDHQPRDDHRRRASGSASR